MIGKEIRLKRLMPTEDGKYFGLTVDHAMGRPMTSSDASSSDIWLIRGWISPTSRQPPPASVPV